MLRDALSASDRVHLLGMVSDGGVHSGFEHLHALIELAAELQVRDLVLHCFTDGRDTSPTSGEGYLATLEGWCRGAGVGRVATVVGRYWAMDRDQRWERTQDAYDLLVHGRADHHELDGPSAARAAYERGETDEFIRADHRRGGGPDPSLATACCASTSVPTGCAEIVRALAEPGFAEGTEDLPGWRGREGLSADPAPGDDDRVPAGLALPGGVHGRAPRDHARGGDRSGRRAPAARGRDREVRSRHVFLQRRPRASRMTGERRALVPSQRDVPTYDHKPQMSARGDHRRVPRRVRRGPAPVLDHQLRQRRHGWPHRRVPAAISGVETIDGCLRRVVQAVHEAGGVCVITADHGNADHMLEDDGSPNTAHSLNRVPLIVTARGVGLAATGSLADVAPTVLALLGIEPPKEMTGRSLLEPAQERPHLTPA